MGDGTPNPRIIQESAAGLKSESQVEMSRCGIKILGVRQVGTLKLLLLNLSCPSLPHKGFCPCLSFLWAMGDPPVASRQWFWSIKWLRTSSHICSPVWSLSEHMPLLVFANGFICWGGKRPWCAPKRTEWGATDRGGRRDRKVSSMGSPCWHYTSLCLGDHHVCLQWMQLTNQNLIGLWKARQCF